MTDTEAKSENSIPPVYIALFVGLVALLLPHSIYFYPGEQLSIYSHVWSFRFGYSELVIYSFSMWMNGLVFVGLRYVFAYQIGRYYMGAISKRRALLWGFVGEIPQLFMTGLYLLSPFLIPLYPQIVLLIPVPSSLILGYILMRINPVSKEPITWRGEKRNQGSWAELETTDPQY